MFLSDEQTDDSILMLAFIVQRSHQVLSYKSAEESNLLRVTVPNFSRNRVSLRNCRSTLTNLTFTTKFHIIYLEKCTLDFNLTNYVLFVRVSVLFYLC